MDDLQRQINELTARVNVLAQAQANTVGFTKVGNDFVFEPASGNVSIKAPANLTIMGGMNVKLAAAGILEEKAGTITLN